MDPQAQQCLETARNRGEHLELPYFGAVTPPECYALLLADPNAVLVDVRTEAELAFVGSVSFSEDRWFHVEWNTFPEGTRNERFIEDIKARVDLDSPLLFLCRSGARSHHAACLAARHGFTKAMNVLEGFEGDKDENHRRSSVNGWRFHKLPWEQH